MSGDNETLGHILLGKSRSAKDFRGRETLRLVPRDPKPSTPPTTSTSSSSSSTSASVLASVSHTPLSSIGYLDLPQDSLRFSVQQLPLRGHQQGRGNSSSNNWLSVRLGRTNVFKQDDTLFQDASKFNSKNVANMLLPGGFIISFMKFNIILICTMTDLSASNDVIMILSRIRWRKKLKFLYF